MKAILLCCALCVCLVVSGCKNAESNLVGKWEGPNNQAAFELKADKTFTSAPPVQTSGTWKTEGKDVLLTITTINGKPKDEMLKETEGALSKGGMAKAQIDSQMEQMKKLMNEMRLTLSDDGQKLTMTPPGGQTLTLTKAKS